MVIVRWYEGERKEFIGERSTGGRRLPFPGAVGENPTVFHFSCAGVAMWSRISGGHLVTEREANLLQLNAAQ